MPAPFSGYSPLRLDPDVRDIPEPPGDNVFGINQASEPRGWSHSFVRFDVTTAHEPFRWEDDLTEDEEYPDRESAEERHWRHMRRIASEPGHPMTSETGLFAPSHAAGRERRGQRWANRWPHLKCT